jgi:hypothetical protein
VTDPRPNDLLVWYIPCPPRRSYRQPVANLGEALTVLDFIRFVQAGIPTQAGVVRWEPDGEGGYEWADVDDHELETVAAFLAAQ